MKAFKILYSCFGQQKQKMIYSILLIGIALAMMTSSHAVSYESDLLAYWKFDEQIGSTTLDATNYNNDGTIIGNTSLTTQGKIGNAYSFDGSGDYIRIAASVSLALANQSFSWSFWVKRSRNGVEELILGQGSPGGSTGLVLGYRASNVFTFAFWANDLDTAAYLDAGVWHHWSGTYDAVNNARKIYRDGQLVMSAATPSDYLGSGAIGIGGGEGGWNTAYFQGLIDEVAIWGRALDSSEVSTIYQSGVDALYSIPEPSTAIFALLGILAALLRSQYQRSCLRA